MDHRDVHGHGPSLGGHPCHRSVRRGSGAGRAPRRVPGSRRRSGCGPVGGRRSRRRTRFAADRSGPCARKEQDPGSLQGPGPNYAAPRSPLRNSHPPSPRVNRQHQTGRRRKGTAFGGRGVGAVLSDFVVTDSARREVLAPRTNRRAERPPTPRVMTFREGRTATGSTPVPAYSAASLLTTHFGSFRAVSGSPVSKS